MRFSYSTANEAKPGRSRFVAVLFLVISLLLFKDVTNGQIVSADSSATTGDSATSLSFTPGDYLAVRDDAPRPLIYSKYFLLMDGLTGDVLLDQQADLSIPIASTTKMVTALTAIELMEPGRVVTISKKPPTIQGSKIELATGEKITLDSLLKGLLIASGNDAAFAIAEAYSGREGDYQTFVKKMNEYLQARGLNKTVLADPAGLDDEQGRSTSRELAHIARLLLQNAYLSRIVATPQTVITSTDGAISHELKSTNRLIQPESGYYLANALGVKTGFTHGAGHSLVGAYRLDGRLLIGVVMNTAEYTNTASAAEMRKLFLWAEANVVKKPY
jgi:D-alanyl-D-alanine carboxypeptidase (penicillin-binding protein 5/6)